MSFKYLAFQKGVSFDILKRFTIEISDVEVYSSNQKYITLSLIKIKLIMDLLIFRLYKYI